MLAKKNNYEKNKSTPLSMKNGKKKIGGNDQRIPLEDTTIEYLPKNPSRGNPYEDITRGSDQRNKKIRVNEIKIVIKILRIRQMHALEMNAHLPLMLASEF